MATIKYLLKNTNSRTATIYVRLRNGVKIDVVTSTGYTIDTKFWNFEKGIVKQSSYNSEKLDLIKKLETLRRFIQDSLNDDQGKLVVINKEWLETTIFRCKNPKVEKKVESIISLVENYQAEMKIKINPKTNKKIAPTTIRNFNTTIMRLENFSKFKQKNYLIHEIDLAFHSDFVRYEREILKLSQNSISKDIKQIKTVCKDARDKGFSINDQVLSSKFNAPTEPTLFVTLNKEDLSLIKNFKGTEYLENARDWLLIGCWTGCRVGDLMKLTEENIKLKSNGLKFIRYVQSKTNKQVDLPIHPDVESILESRGGFPKPISDQRFNEWIKIVCKKVNINSIVEGTRQNPNTHLKEIGKFEKWELIRSHTCRRSFATNHYNLMPNKMIMAVTGHATEKMLLNYIGETENAHLDDFAEFWNNEKIS